MPDMATLPQLIEEDVRSLDRAARQIAAHMAAAQQREPVAGLDLSVLNIADTADLFKQKFDRYTRSSLRYLLLL